MTRRLLALLLILTAGAAAAGDGHYVVREGDSLGRIAQRFGVGLEDLRGANPLPGDVLHPRQELTVPQPFRRMTSPRIRWQAPLERGAGVLRPFGVVHQGRLAARRTGADVRCARGVPVLAPADAHVLYVGEQDGFGLIALLDHGAGYATVLGPLDPDGPLVARDDLLLAGDPVGRVGEPVDGSIPYLHIELRRHHEAVDPARILP
ncbi:MAG TPA: LysM peptidoglycan-binding domain-containing M23 family metallopeptidase [Candidatus Krumholzibacteria bacterium]|nr:LysM peptidoglycan-binding domain-containing M23 family metallopeptidase [Candidatus Krumholzibacteria bacterium]HRX50744.1 LysM peptidoglycan-binding domain-containing M23 family metallopeptidase [Candidatus Krumholzibacteria bacterium]